MCGTLCFTAASCVRADGRQLREHMTRKEEDLL